MEKFTIAQVAQALGMHAMTIQKLILEGYIRSVKEGRRRLVTAEELNKVLAIRNEHGRDWLKSIQPSPPARQVGSPTAPLTR